MPESPPPDTLHRTARYYRVPRRRRSWLSVVGWSLWGVVGVITGLAFASYLFLDDTLSQASPDTPEVRRAIQATRPAEPGKPVNVLLIGSDVRPDDTGNGLSDSLILVRIDSQRDQVSMLSFPRDLYTDVPGIGFTKLNNAYGLGGTEKAIETISKLTGQEVNHFVNIDFDGFSNLVDSVGGVYIDVDRRYFNDNSGCTPGAGNCYEMIDLEPGYQKLNGVDALDFVRYRHTDSDFIRAARQQLFLAELKRQTNQFGNLRKFREFAQIFSANVITSVDSVREMLSIMEAALTTPDERIARVRIIGRSELRGSASVVIVPDATIQTAVAEWLNPEFETGEPETPVTPGTVGVRVDNGSGRVLVARTVAEQLRQVGFSQTVVGGSAARKIASTQVLYDDDSRAAAARIAERMGESAIVIPGSEDELRGSDVVVVVGPDYTGQLQQPPPPKERPENAAPARTMVDTNSLVETFRNLRSATRMEVMVPLKLPSGASVRRVRAYRVNTGGRNEPNAIKVVFAHPDGGYFGLAESDMKDPPILDGRTGVVKSGGREYWTYYDGPNLQRLAWRKGKMSYWINNTYDYALSDREMYAIAKSARPMNRATLPAGATNTAVSVEYEASTP
jgi:LCP family protein required for cell wall assembly